MKSFIVLVTLLALAHCTPYPLFKQCDSQWGSNKLGTSSNTICSSGCLMSSVSMVINDCKKLVDGSAANPGTLNKWLTKNGGYASGDLFIWDSVKPFGLTFEGFETVSSTIISKFNAQYAVILNVNNGGHYVLMTGVSGSSFLVNDPGFSKTSYPQSEVVKAGYYARPSGCATT
jgi:hypothetical protein